MRGLVRDLGSNGTWVEGEFRELLLVDREYIRPYPFEEMDINAWRRWMGRYWIYSIFISLFYIFCIFGGQRLMKDRKPFRLRLVSLVWNTAFAIFSLVGFFRGIPEFYVLLKQDIFQGFHNYVCTWEEHNTSAAFWGGVYAASKFTELIGTGLIILKKSQLHFLHWTHHVTAFVYCCYIYESYDTTMRWSGLTNSFVHGIVYLYLVLKGLGASFGYEVPRHWAVKMTTLQIVEMLCGVLVNFYTLNAKTNGKKCYRTLFHINLTLGLYAFFALLFIQYFYSSYMKKKMKKE